MSQLFEEKVRCLQLLWHPNISGSRFSYEMEGQGSAETQTPFSSASTATLDEIPETEMREMEMPPSPVGEILSETDLEKQEKHDIHERDDLRDGEIDFLVEFDGPDDLENPQNWSKAKRWGITLSMGMMT